MCCSFPLLFLACFLFSSLSRFLFSLLSFFRVQNAFGFVFDSRAFIFHSFFSSAFSFSSLSHSLFSLVSFFRALSSLLFSSAFLSSRAMLRTDQARGRRGPARDKLAALSARLAPAAAIPSPSPLQTQNGYPMGTHFGVRMAFGDGRQPVASSMNEASRLRAEATTRAERPAKGEALQQTRFSSLAVR